MSSFVTFAAYSARYSNITQRNDIQRGFAKTIHCQYQARVAASEAEPSKGTKLRIKTKQASVLHDVSQSI